LARTKRARLVRRHGARIAEIGDTETVICRSRSTRSSLTGVLRENGEWCADHRVGRIGDVLHLLLVTDDRQ
jgi:hypothetical protein